MPIAENQVEEFTRYRPFLFAIAYRMLGTVSDSEDILQEAFLRWQAAVTGPTEPIATPKSWLTAVVTRLCIDHLRSARVRREEYVGPWLPEPIVGQALPDAAETVILQESLTLAFLIVLESLTPTERAVFLLHDVFAYEYAEIASMVGKSEATCRQIARRARAHITERRPRARPTPDEQTHLTNQFLTACSSGDLTGLMATLANDVVLRSDGGGKVAAARQPILGASNVARFLLGIIAKAPPTLRTQQLLVNGQPGLLAVADSQVVVLALDIDAGRIQSIAFVTNPDKLRHLPPSLSA